MSVFRVAADNVVLGSIDDVAVDFLGPCAFVLAEGSSYKVRSRNELSRDCLRNDGPGSHNLKLRIFTI